MTLTFPYKALMRSVGGYLPDRIVTNEDLSKYVDTSHEWIVERTGIESRHFVAESGQLTSDLAVRAAQDALASGQLTPQDIDMVIVATTTPDCIFPSTATRVQDKLGMKQGFAFDVAAVCAGFMVALNVADTFIKTGQAKRILVIGAEILSTLLDMTDRRTCVLFADGAGAVVLEATEPENERGIIGIKMQSDGSLFDVLHALGPREKARITMQGQELFRHAVVKLARAAEDILQTFQVSPEELDWLIPHQANLRIIEGMAKKLNMPMDKVITTVQTHANTSAASIPLALNHGVKSGKVKPGDLILHEAIGGGLVWGAGLVRY
jgi:3-oxoacyl-[acyl-carrier-protein] synthase-3